VSAINEEAFAHIVDAAAKELPGIRRVVQNGYNVTLKFASGSGKTILDAVYRFDPRTGDFSCVTPYINAKIPRWFGDAIQSAIRSSLGGK